MIVYGRVTKNGRLKHAIDSDRPERTLCGRVVPREALPDGGALYGPVVWNNPGLDLCLNCADSRRLS